MSAAWYRRYWSGATDTEPLNLIHTVNKIQKQENRTGPRTEPCGTGIQMWRRGDERLGRSWISDGSVDSLNACLILMDTFLLSTPHPTLKPPNSAQRSHGPTAAGPWLFALGVSPLD